MLVGTDFNPGIKGIGPKKGYKIVEGAGSFAEVQSRAKEANFPSEGVENSDEIERFFMNPPVEQNPAIEFGKPDVAAVSDYLCNEFEFSRERVERTLNALEKKMKETGAQTKLGDW